MCQAAISSYVHYLPKSSALPPSGCCEDLHLMQEDRLPSPFRTQGWERHNGTHTNPHPRLSSEAATWTPSETSSHRGTSPPCQTSSMRWRSLLLYLQYLACCLAQQRCSIKFSLPKQNNPTKEQAGAPPCLQRPVFKALTHLDLSHPGDRSGHVSEATWWEFCQLGRSHPP